MRWIENCVLRPGRTLPANGCWRVPVVCGITQSSINKYVLDGRGLGLQSGWPAAWRCCVAVEGRSPGGELVSGANKLPEPVALRGLHCLDDVMVPPVRTDLVDAVEVRILHGTVEFTHSESYAIPSVVVGAELTGSSRFDCGRCSGIHRHQVMQRHTHSRGP